MMEEKMRVAIWKLNRTPIVISNAYVFFNIYLTLQVYFGCGIVKLMLQQENILKKISEPVLLKKLGLSKKFSRDVLYARKLSLSIGLLQPNMILASLLLKMYLDHMRIQDTISKIIQINKENTGFQYRYNKELLSIPIKYKQNISI